MPNCAQSLRTETQRMNRSLLEQGEGFPGRGYLLCKDLRWGEDVHGREGRKEKEQQRKCAGPSGQGLQGDGQHGGLWTSGQQRPWKVDGGVGGWRSQARTLRRSSGLSWQQWDWVFKAREGQHVITGDPPGGGHEGLTLNPTWPECRLLSKVSASRPSAPCLLSRGFKQTPAGGK